MDARREPRFSIYGPVKVTLLSKPDHALDCVLLDISATGLKLIAPESLPPDEVLSMEAEDHLALAEVRYSQPRGDKFTVGCQRIQVLNKVSSPDEKPSMEQMRLVAEEYHNRTHDGIETPAPERIDALAKSEEPVNPPGEKPAMVASPPIDAASFTTREQLLDAAAGWVVEHWDEIPASPHGGAVGRSEIVDRLTVHLAERLRPPVPLPAPVETSKKKQPRAQKVVDQKNVRHWRLPIGLAVAAVLGWGLSALFWSMGSSGAASHLPASIAQLISPKDAPPAAPVSAVRHIQITAIEPTWIIATSDGKRLFNKKLTKDDVREIEFSDKATLRIGNAKGVEITLDGKSIGPIGGRGQPRLVEFSADGFRLLPLN